jgi:hypothetical protein
MSSRWQPLLSMFSKAVGVKQPILLPIMKFSPR